MNQNASMSLMTTINNAQFHTAAALRDKASVKDKARAAAEDFEAVFLNSMFNQMFTGVEGEGPFGGSKEMGVWRSMMTDEYSRSFAKKGGIGIADQVYSALLAQQEAGADSARAAR
jgi:Rod binding domain-containing protein